MKLLHVDTLSLVSFTDTPPVQYAILSHTWLPAEKDEVQYSDIVANGVRGCPDKPGKFKVEGCCRQAKADGYQYVWIDTCCIDKDSTNELSSAINSMYRWYQEAAVCYVYMSDVPPGREVLDDDGAFAKSRWFTRGWTLQEMLAPPELHFFNRDWKLLTKKDEIYMKLMMITGVPLEHLRSFHPATAKASAAQRMSWAAQRSTTREEDLAYCLLGLFGVTFPMIYGEGGRSAFARLQQEIIEKKGDHSVLAWGLGSDQVVTSVNVVPFSSNYAAVEADEAISGISRISRISRISGSSGIKRSSSGSTGSSKSSRESNGIWASEPRDFANCGNITRVAAFAGECTFANGNMRLEMNLCVDAEQLEPSPAFLFATSSSPNSSSPAALPYISSISNTVWTSTSSVLTSIQKSYLNYPRAVRRKNLVVFGLLNYGPSPSAEPLVVAIPLLLVSATSSGISKNRDVLYHFMRPKDMCPIIVNRSTAIGPKEKRRSVTIQMSPKTIDDLQDTGLKAWTGFQYPLQHLRLSEMHPEPAWQGGTLTLADTKDAAIFKPYNAVWYLARLCPVQDEGAAGTAQGDKDIVAVIRQRPSGVSCCLMSMSRSTSLAEIAASVCYMPSSIYEKPVATTKGVFMEMTYEEAHGFLIRTTTDVRLRSPLDAEQEMAHVANIRKIPTLLDQAAELVNETEDVSKQSAANLEALREAELCLSDISFRLESLQAEKIKMEKLVATLTREEETTRRCKAGMADEYSNVLKELDEKCRAADAKDASSGPGNWLARILLQEPSKCQDCMIVCKPDGLFDVDNTTGQEGLYVAVCRKSVAQAQYLLERGADPSKLLRHQTLPLLCIAAKSGDTRMVELLLGKGASPDEADSDGYPALWHALSITPPETAAVLVQKKANIDAQTKAKEPLLHLAVKQENRDTVHFLVDNGALLPSHDSKIWKKALKLVAQAPVEHRRLLELFLSLKELDCKQCATSLLASAVEEPDHAFAVELILSSRCSRFFATEQIVSIATDAARKGSFPLFRAVVKSMSQKLFDQTIESRPLLTAAIRGGSPEAVNYLLELGCPLYEDALEHAIEKWEPEIVQSLLKHDDSGVLPRSLVKKNLYRAVKNASHEMARIFLENGADPNYAPGLHETPLKRAKKMGDEEMVRILEASYEAATAPPELAKRKPIVVPQRRLSLFLGSE